MEKEQLIQEMRAARGEWNRLVEAVPPRLRNAPVHGSWTVKDLAAHLTWTEAEWVRVIGAKSMEAGSPWWTLSDDEMNERIVAERRDSSVDDVLAEGNRNHAALLDAVSTLSEEELANRPFRGMSEGWPELRTILRGNFVGHYQLHSAELGAWLATQSEEQ